MEITCLKNAKFGYNVQLTKKKTKKLSGISFWNNVCKNVNISNVDNHVYMK